MVVHHPFLLRLFQHTFGTHLFRNLYQQAIYRDSFHNWRCRGIAGRVCDIGVRCNGPHTFNESTCLESCYRKSWVMQKIWPPETNNHNKGEKISYIICIYIYKPPSTVLIYTCISPQIIVLWFLPNGAPPFCDSYPVKA